MIYMTAKAQTDLTGVTAVSALTAFAAVQKNLSCTVTFSTSLVGSPSIVFNQSNGRTVVITAGAKIDGDTVSATYTQPFGVTY